MSIIRRGQKRRRRRSEPYPLAHLVGIKSLIWSRTTCARPCLHVTLVQNPFLPREPSPIYVQTRRARNRRERSRHTTHRMDESMYTYCTAGRERERGASGSSKHPFVTHYSHVGQVLLCQACSTLLTRARGCVHRARPPRIRVCLDGATRHTDVVHPRHGAMIDLSILALRYCAILVFYIRCR